MTTNTCIVSYVRKGKIYMGGDSAGVAGMRITVRTDPKVFIRTDESGNKWIFGFTTSFRMGQLIQYSLKIPSPKKKEADLNAFMVKKFIPALRKCLQDGGWEHREKDRVSAGKFLVGIRGRVFTIDEDYQVGESASPFASVGCGADTALGALSAALAIDPEIKPERLLTLALETATHLNGGVRPPFAILSV